MAKGGLVQIVCVGGQDKYISHAPQITYFKTKYLKHVAFSMQDFLLLPEQNITLSTKKYKTTSTEFIIRQYADLAFRPMLKIELPDIEAYYVNTVQYYIDNFLNSKHMNNVTTNIILSALMSLINNFENSINTIFINNNSTVTYDYENINFGNFETIKYVKANFESSNPITEFDFVAKHRTVCKNNDSNFQRQAFYSSLNINYLATELSKLELSENIILTRDDYYKLFKDCLFEYIIGDDENKFIYSIINNTSPYDTGYDARNIQSNVTNKITYNLEYYYSNMQLLFIYDKNKKLKSIFHVKNYSYSSNNYINNVIPVKNLYSIFEYRYTTQSKKLYIADGFDANKKMNIYEIQSVTKINSTTYNILSNISGNENTLYFIYVDKTAFNHGKSFQNSYPGVEDYYDLFFNAPDEMNPECLLSPLCVLSYNSDTGYYEQMSFTNEITTDDYIYTYKDVLIYDLTVECVSYVIIGNYLYNIHTNSTSSNKTAIKYTDSVNIYDPMKIENYVVKSLVDGETLFLVSKDDENLLLVDPNTGEQYIGKDYIYPFKINITLSSDERLLSISSVSNLTLNLDSYVNTNFILDSIKNYNKTSSEKKSILQTNILNTKLYNSQHITKFLESMFNYMIIYKFYNAYTFNSSTSAITYKDPSYYFNTLSYLLPSNSLNGTNNYYCSLQSEFLKLYNSFTEKVDSKYSDFVRLIFNLDDTLGFLNTIINIKQNPYFLKIPGIKSIKYYNTTTIGNLSKIAFKVTSEYTDHLQILQALGLTFYTDSDFYIVKDMLYEQVTVNGEITMLLSPFTSTANLKFYLFVNLLNKTSINGVYPFDNFYVLPNKASIDENIDDYSFTINRASGYLNIRSTFDTLTNNNSSHFSSTIYSLTNTKSKFVDIKYVLYHYTEQLYTDIRDRTLSISSNKFALYIDIKMFEQLWLLKQSINKMSNNGNSLSVNLNNDVTTNLFIDCNISMTEFYDHVIINNSLRQFKEYFLLDIILPKTKQVILNNTGWFSFYNKTSIRFYDFDESSKSSLDVNLLLQDGITSLKYYLFYLNAIMSDVKQYAVNDNAVYILTNPTIEYILTLLSFFDDKTNCFNSSYLGTNIEFTETEYDIIIDVNEYIKDLIKYITFIIKDRNLKDDEGEIKIYSEDSSSSIVTKTLISSVKLDDFFDFTRLYTNNFMYSYEYKDLLPFFNDFKNEYMLLQYNTIAKIRNQGSYCCDIFDKITQDLNFSIEDYIKKTNWLNLNELYNPNIDFLLSKTSYADVDLEANYDTSSSNSLPGGFGGGGGNVLTYSSIRFDGNAKYAYKILSIPNINSSSSPIKIFYKFQETIIANENNNLLSGKNLLNIEYENLSDLIDNFNRFFTKQYSFYSDFKILYVLYFYFYKTFTFTMNSIDYVLTFDKTDSTSENNIITDGVNTYYYSWILFTDNDSLINYTVKNKKLYDVSNSTNINYVVTYEMVIDKIIKQYDVTHSYVVDGQNIVDLNDSFVYNIQGTNIYDISSTCIGNIYTDKYGETIFKINGKLYKKELLKSKLYVLFANYQDVPIVDEKVYINNTSYKIVYNSFHDNNYIKFKVAIPFIEPYTNSTSTNIYLGIVGGVFTDDEGDIFSDGVYGTLYSELKPKDLYDTDNINIHSVFLNSFTNSEIKSCISYLQDEIIQKLYSIDIQGKKTLLPNLCVKLLRNIYNNSILPFNNYIEDTLKILNYNNWIKYNDLQSVISDVVSYNETSTNQIYIFDETNQQFLLPYENYTTTNTIHFVPIRKIYNDSLKMPFTNSFNEMLSNCSVIKQYSLKTNYEITEKIKVYVIEMILKDIENEQISNIYYSNVFFNYDGNVTWTNDKSLMSSNSYFIRNAQIINREEYDYIESFSGIYENCKYYYVYNDTKYLINLVTELTNYDFTSNGHFYKIESEIVNILPTNEMKMINIKNGKLLRRDCLDCGFFIDESVLKYNFEYDLLTHKMLTTSKKFNEIIYKDKTFENINGVATNNEIVMEKYVNILHEYIMINDEIYYVLEQNENNVKVYGTLLNGDVVIESDVYKIIKKLGFERLWYKTVFWYFENLISSIDNLKTFIEDNEDSYYEGKLFSCNNYIENLYDNMYVIMNKSLFDTHDNSLTDTYGEIYNVLTFNSNNINSIYKNILSLANQYNENYNLGMKALLRDPIPKCSWINYLGHFICDTVSFYIGNEKIEEINDHIIHIYNLNNFKNHVENMNKMIGHNSRFQYSQQYINGGTILINLPMCISECTKALPLLALLNSKLCFKVVLKDLLSLVNVNDFASVRMKSKFKINLSMTYVFLEQVAKEKFARSRHEYLYEVKKCLKFNIESNEENKYVLIDEHNPCKEMMWFYIDQKNKNKNNFWNYTSDDYKIYDPDNLECVNIDNSDNVTRYMSKFIKSGQTIWSIKSNELQMIKNFIRTENSKIRNPFTNSLLRFNGYVRFDKEGDETNIIEPYLFMDNIYIQGLNMKNFGRRTDLTHMGYLNLSAAHDMRLEYELDKPNLKGEINVILSTYQIIRMVSGFGSSLWK